jgi:hypothetical protein
MPSFSKTLGDYISLPKSKRDKVSKPLDVGVTPLSLIAVGAKPLPVVINPNDVDKCLAGRTANKNKNSHELTFKELKALPELIANPVMIFKDPRNENYIGIISDTFDKNGNPLLIAIELNFEQERHMVNRVASVHGRPHAFENFVARNGNEVQGFIPRNIAEGNLLAVNIEKATNFFQSTGLHLPERKDSFVTFDNTITHSLDSVKRFEEKNLQEDIMAKSELLKLQKEAQRLLRTTSENKWTEKVRLYLEKGILPKIPEKFMVIFGGFSEESRAVALLKEYIMEDKMKNIVKMFANEKKYQLDGYAEGYSQSIDRDQAIDEVTGKAYYDSYCFIEIATGTKHEVTAAEMEDFFADREPSSVAAGAEEDEDDEEMEM